MQPRSPAPAPSRPHAGSIHDETFPRQLSQARSSEIGISETPLGVLGARTDIDRRSISPLDGEDICSYKQRGQRPAPPECGAPRGPPRRTAMTSTLSPPPSVARRSERRKTAASARIDHVHTRQRQRRGARPECRVLAHYTDATGCAREVVVQRGYAGSALVVDRELASRGDRRLVAHLGADEPAANAELECERYLTDSGRGRCRCRLLSAADLRTAPYAEDADAERSAASAGGGEDLLDERGRSYRLEPLLTGMSIPELRWTRHPGRGVAGEPRSVSVRDAIAHLESYEPVRAMTIGALACTATTPMSRARYCAPSSGGSRRAPSCSTAACA